MQFNRTFSAYQQQSTRNRVASSDSYTYFNLLTGPELLDQVESLLPPHRERLFPPTETLSIFLAQARNEDRSCQAVVNQAVVTRMLSGLPDCSTHTGAYCRARQRLPTAMVTSLACATGRLMSERVPAAWRWCGRPVRLVDGTTVAMPDTAVNQVVYPQPGSQKPGLGFPLCRLVGILCLSSGAVLNAATGPYQGKGSGEQALLRSLLNTLAEGDILLGDAFFATYFLLCALQERGVDGVFEQLGARKRKTDFGLGHRLGQRDHLITWDKPKLKPAWMSQEDFDQAPDTLTLRELQRGGKIIVTTLLCPKQTPKAALKQLYRSRWHIELDLRAIKTTLGMEMLSCKTPAMIIKEIWVYLLAYNLIRLLMLQAASLSDVLPRQLSFKHALQLWNACERCRLAIDNGSLQRLFVLIVQQRVGNRRGRVEPRAVKRRPKPYPLLTKQRQIAREEIRKYGHPKKLK
jgi:hypothetical protein